MVSCFFTAPAKPAVSAGNRPARAVSACRCRRRRFAVCTTDSDSCKSRARGRLQAKARRRRFSPCPAKQRRKERAKKLFSALFREVYHHCRRLSRKKRSPAKRFSARRPFKPSRGAAAVLWLAYPRKSCFKPGGLPCRRLLPARVHKKSPSRKQRKGLFKLLQQIFLLLQDIFSFTLLKLLN